MFKMSTKAFYLFNLLFIQSTFAAIPQLKSEPSIRVKIASRLKEVNISGLDLQKSMKGNDQLKNFAGLNNVKFNCQNSTKNALNNKKSSILLASLSSPTGLLSWEKEIYKGSLEIAATEGHESCDLINQVSMEDYISSLLAKEMNAKWPLEALKAQAVAARSYGIHLMHKNPETELYHLESAERHQVNGSFGDRTYSTDRAARETYGEVMVNTQGKLVPVFYHSKCGGQTLKPEDVWTNPISGYQAVKCPHCHPYGRKSWQAFVSNADLASAYTGLNAKDEFLLVPDRQENAQFRFYQNGQVRILRKSDLRRKLGRKEIPSNYLSLKQTEKGFLVEGEGYGHGVGLCQFGAYALAKKGWSYDNILRYYFPQFKIKRLY